MANDTVYARTNEDAADSDTLIGAAASIHDAIRITGPDAVVFNPIAAPLDLVAYAHGQMVVLRDVLFSLGEDNDHEPLHNALRSIIEPAITALRLASSEMLSGARGG
ncbi:MAG: hypothetical protein JO006_09505 [Paucibacter sp.]|nr:hypothetical protein [Roseateles sp.]